MAEVLLYLRFKEQTGNFYWFEGAFYEDGYELPQFGEGAFPSQPDFAGLLAACPATLLQGSYIWTYEVPTNLTLRSIKAVPWVTDSVYDDLEDILVSLTEETAGLFLTNKFDVLYTPTFNTPLPTEQQAVLPDAIDCGDAGLIYLPDYEDWPAGRTNFTPAASVSQSGAWLMPEWAWIWTGTLPETSMLHLIDHQYLIEPYPQPYIDVRYDEGPYSNLYRFWEAYDTRYPESRFTGFIGLPGLIDVHTGVGTSEEVDFVVVVSTPPDTYIPILSNTVPGYAIGISIYRGSDSYPAYIFNPLPPQTRQDWLPEMILTSLALYSSLLSKSFAFGRLPRLSAPPQPLPIGGYNTKPIGGATTKPLGGTL